MIKIAVTIIAFAALCVPAAWAADSAGSAANASPVRAYYGPAVAVGKGSARTIVLADGRHQVTGFGVEFTARALDGLPPQPSSDKSLDWPYFLRFAKNAPATGFDHVMMNYHPMGHPPKDIYTVPHIDFHFYLIDMKRREAIKYLHEETDDMTGVAMPSPALLAPDYFIPPGTQVNRMGVHAVDKNAPEFHGKPFTHTMIYGYDNNGELAFLEPMIATAYLRTQPDVLADVLRPQSYSFAADYPGRYSVRYDARTQTYQVMFGDLKPEHPTKLSSTRSN